MKYKIAEYVFRAIYTLPLEEFTIFLQYTYKKMSHALNER